MMIVLIVLAALALGLGLWLIGIYNSLVRNRNMVREAWSGVDVQLKRRSDLIPNLVETVKGYAGHERQLLEQVTLARARAMGAQSQAERAEAEGMLSGFLGRLIAVGEQYPDLKASANYLELQGSLADIEDEIQMARRYYNGAVRELNTAIESFPANLVAGPLGFQPADFFELENPADRETPQVSFA